MKWQHWNIHSNKFQCPGNKSNGSSTTNKSSVIMIIIVIIMVHGDSRPHHVASARRTNNWIAITGLTNNNNNQKNASFFIGKTTTTPPTCSVLECQRIVDFCTTVGKKRNNIYPKWKRRNKKAQAFFFFFVVCCCSPCLWHIYCLHVRIFGFMQNEHRTHAYNTVQYNNFTYQQHNMAACDEWMNDHEWMNDQTNELNKKEIRQGISLCFAISYKHLNTK